MATRRKQSTEGEQGERKRDIFAGHIQKFSKVYSLSFPSLLSPTSAEIAILL